MVSPELLSDFDDPHARRMLEQAEVILSAVDEAYIVTQRGHKVREMPVFRPEEISLGKKLGMGGFGIVNEIRAFFLDKDENDQCYAGENPQEMANNGAPTNRNRLEETTTSDGDGTKPKTAPKDTKHDLIENTHVHYEITKARHMMQQRAQRNGSARYALKRLHGGLTDLERARGMIDLAVEAKFLSVVWHPNIIKMRGMADGPLLDPDFFIILDRLQETLDKRMNQWHHDDKKTRGGILGIGRNKFRQKQLLIDRLTVAYDLAAAFFYLHENRIVYRDIKPENVGFDIRGDVKVFDLGLCKSLSPSLKATEGYGYRLTGRAGSLPYMAPEVVKMEPYDTKCDVFSFAILLWEMLALKQAYQGYTPTQYVENVTVQRERLPVDKHWPPLTRLMIPEAWDHDPRSRPDMKRVAILIRGDLNDMTTDETIRDRTSHMKDRSNHSMQNLDSV